MKNNYPDVKMSDVDGSNPEVLKKLDSMFDACKEARKPQIGQWRRNEELVNGEILKPFNMPKYKSKIQPGIPGSIVETMYSILSENPHRVNLMPKRADQVESAMKAQDVIDYYLSEKKAHRAINMAKRDMLVYGNGFIKLAIIDGEVEFINVSPFQVLVDPLATNMDDIQSLVFCSPTYVDDVKARYGKKVEPEGVLDEYQSFIKDDKRFASDRFRASDLTEKSPSKKEMKTDYRGGMCLLKEAFYYDDGKLMLATWVDKTVLQEPTESPYPFMPLVTFINYQNGQSIWGRGEPQSIESECVGASIILSQAVDSVILTGNSPMVMSKSLAKTQGNVPTDRPGQIIWLNNSSEMVQRIPPGNMSSSALPMAEYLLQMAETVSSVDKVSRGHQPGGVTAGKAIEALQSASVTIIRAKEREIGSDAVIDLYKMTLYMLANNYSKTISIRKEASDGAGYEFVEVQPYDLDPDLSFKYVVGSAMPESRASRMDQAIDLLQLGLLDEKSFWKWTQQDQTKERLDSIAQEEAMQEQQMAQEMDIIQNSENEDEIMDALLRQRELSGIGQQTDQLQEGVNE